MPEPEKTLAGQKPSDNVETKRKTLYEQGEEIRKDLPLNSAQRKNLEIAKQMNARKLFTATYKDIPEKPEESQLKQQIETQKDAISSWRQYGLDSSDLEQVIHLAIAFERAKNYFSKHGISSQPDGNSNFSPAGDSIDKKIPCQVEQIFAKRKGALEDAIQNCPEPRKSVLLRFLKQDPPNHNLAGLNNQVSAAYNEIRTREFQAMVCEHEAVSTVLEQYAYNTSYTFPAIQTMDKLLTVMEKVADSKCPLDLNDILFCNYYIDQPGMFRENPPATSTTIKAEFSEPSPNLLNNPTLEGIKQYADDVSRGWFSQLTPDTADGFSLHTSNIADGFHDLLSQFTSATAGGSHKRSPATDQSAILQVDNIPIDDHLKNLYRRQGNDLQSNDPDAFERFCEDNRGRMLIAALMAGKRVKNLVTQEVIQPTGFAPPRDNPAFWNVWGQFCNEYFPESVLTTDIATGSQIRSKDKNPVISPTGDSIDRKDSHQIERNFAQRKNALEDAAQNCPEPRKSALLRFLKQDQNYKSETMNKLLTVMEKVADPKRPLDLNDISLYNHFVGQPGMSREDSVNQKDSNPHYSRQLSEPPSRLLNFPRRSGFLHYAANASNGWFAQICPLDTPDTPAWERANAVLVDGVSILKRMTERYRTNHPDLSGFDDWLEENLNDMGSIMMIAGLMAGKRVVACNTNPPTPLRLTGFTPPRDDSKFWNAWGRFCNHWIPGSALTIDIATDSQVQHKKLDKFEIEFANLEKSSTSFFGLFSPERELDKCLEDYAIKTVEPALTNLFEPMEQLYKDYAPCPPIDRNTLTIVDGKTVFAWLEKMHCDLKKKDPKNTPEFSEWYQKNGKGKGAQIVAAGLMAGKNVEAFVPGPDGTLPDQPIPIQKTGYAPNKAKTAWERYLRNFGGNDAIVAQHPSADAREWIRSSYAIAQAERANPAHPAMFDMFFGKILKEKDFKDWNALCDHYQLPADSPFRSPTTAVVCCIGGLVSVYDSDIQDILNPLKLQTEKQEVAQEYINLATGLLETPLNEQRSILATGLFNIFIPVLSQGSEIIYESNEDNPQQRRAVMPALYCIGKVVNYAKEEYERFSSPIDDSTIKNRIDDATACAEQLLGAEKACAAQAAPKVSQAAQKQKGGLAMK